jgi:hypothetical protein
MRRLLVTTSILLAAALGGGSQALASGGSYTFDGGTRAEQSQVRAALAASSFDWSLVPATVTIHITPGLPASEAAPGEIWLSAELLDAGTFAWGIVQHEYAHQVDFLLLSPGARATLSARLGGEDWCYGVPGLAHASYGCERFASTLAWAYWPSRLNSMRPSGPADESAAMRPASFRFLLDRLLSPRRR